MCKQEVAPYNLSMENIDENQLCIDAVAPVSEIGMKTVAKRAFSKTSLIMVFLYFHRIQAITICVMPQSGAKMLNKEVLRDNPIFAYHFKTC